MYKQKQIPCRDLFLFIRIFNYLSGNYNKVKGKHAFKDTTGK